MLTAMNALSAVSNRVSSAAGAPASLGGAQQDRAVTAAPFSSLITDAVGEVSALDEQASNAVTGLMTGRGVDVHQAMIATEKADMAFELALAVRNKAVQAYQSVMGMQF